MMFTFMKNKQVLYIDKYLDVYDAL